MDGKNDRPASLILYEDEHVIAHVPKAQRSQGEVQVMAKTAGNILELNETARESINKAIYRVMQAFSRMGVKMNTAYEVSRRFDRQNGQLLFYCFLPRHPDSPGAFSERQERWITGHYPEDYAAHLRSIMK
jgi:galactose-1-phosphate uridylyltransferase